MFINSCSILPRGRTFVCLFFFFAGGLFLTPSAFANADKGLPSVVYTTGMVFAVAGKSCPNGSEPLRDPVYQKAGSLDGVIYCSFRAKSFLYPESCPTGFKENARESRGGEELRRCQAVIEGELK
jgi:hypothetical protein